MIHLLRLPQYLYMYFNRIWMSLFWLLLQLSTTAVARLPTLIYIDRISQYVTCKHTSWQLFPNSTVLSTAGAEKTIIWTVSLSQTRSTIFKMFLYQTGAFAQKPRRLPMQQIKQLLTFWNNKKLAHAAKLKKL